MVKGKCNCGAVSFKINASMKDVYICHCSICRRATGGTGIAVGIAKMEFFTWLSGQEKIKIWAKPNHDWETSFCTECGSSLPGSNDSKTMYVPVGLLTEGADDLKVAHHIFVGSKASWEQIGDDGQQHLEHIS